MRTEFDRIAGSDPEPRSDPQGEAMDGRVNPSPPANIVYHQARSRNVGGIGPPTFVDFITPINSVGCCSDKVSNGGNGYTSCQNDASSTWADVTRLVRVFMTSVRPELNVSSFCPKIRVPPR
jgi:hypothetical protein